MQRLTIFMIVVVTLFDFLGSGDRFGNGGFLPSSISYFAELVSAAAMAYVIFAGTRNRFQFVRPAYWLSFGSLLLVIIFALIANHVDSGPIIAGMRSYLRAMPWFFIPAVYAFSEEEVRGQFKVLLAICFIEVPVAVLQRIQTADRSWGFVAVTGDWTTGTLGDAGTLSIFLVCAICIITALFERKKLSLFRFILLFFVVLVPTMINETKAMVAFLPLGLLLTFLYASPPEIRYRKVFGGVALLLVFGAVFVPVYDALNADRQYGQSLGDFFFKEGNVDAYVSTGGAEVGTTKDIGRGDSIAVPIKELSKDPVSLLFGLGIGNASDSSLGPGFNGFYADKWRVFLQTQFSRFILELGALGVTLILFIYLLIFQDCKAVARADKGTFGAMAAGMTGVIGLITLTMFYSKIEVFPSLSYLFWYFAGLIAAHRMRMVSVRDVAPAREQVGSRVALSHGTR